MQASESDFPYSELEQPMGGNSHISLGNSFNEKRGARKDNQQLLVCSLSIGQRNLNYTSISITTIESHSSIGGMDNNRVSEDHQKVFLCQTSTVFAN